ncbi:hypothetical protein HAX54_028811, partial [Datura stramonium]|nr:hypothetical protein [Datura stramonium]
MEEYDERGVKPPVIELPKEEFGIPIVPRQARQCNTLRAMPGKLRTEGRTTPDHPMPQQHVMPQPVHFRDTS